MLQNSNYLRNTHDLFNFIILIPLNLFNLMNWKFKNGIIIFDNTYFSKFRICCYLYFFIDTIWIWFFPKCVRSPRLLYFHHVLAFAAIYGLKNIEFQKFTSLSLLVEINTWFLITRRLFNNDYFIRYNKYNNIGIIYNIQIKITSIGFYTSWIITRLGIMPYVCYHIFRFLYYKKIFINLVAFIFQSIFTLLGFKWTYDLILTKLQIKRSLNGL